MGASRGQANEVGTVIQAIQRRPAMGQPVEMVKMDR